MTVLSAARAAITSTTTAAGPPAARAGRRRALAGVLGAQACALTVTRMLLIAVPWLVWSSTGNTAQAGLVLLGQTMPYALTQWLAGPLLDRIGPRRISIAGDLTSAGLLAVLAVGTAGPVWLIGLILAGVGAADGPAAAAKRLLLPIAATDAGHSVTRGAGYAIVIERAATTVGPALTGWLIVAAGGATALWVSAALLAAAAGIATRTVTDPPRDHCSSRYASRLRAGAGYLRHHQSLRALTTMFLATNLIDQALISILLPTWAHTGGHSPAMIGLALGVAAGTAGCSALVTARLSDRLPRRGVYLIAVIVAGPTRIAALAADWPPEAVIAVWGLAGLGAGVFNPIVEAVQIESVPAELRGRVLTLINALAWAGIPVGGLVGAGLLATAGLPAAAGVCAIAYLVAVCYPGWRVNWQPTPGANPGEGHSGTAPLPSPHHSGSTASDQPERQRHRVSGRATSTRGDYR
ncbi:MFS transporter [Actinoplanes sp. ATCC 53533]|uniref:MFS transporter n=1 Tax=Actinoplanes sp. ATCC 53533 TaxID=1288362 RepID=UPI001F19C046|nr:MFS transporter [Actinoplanes sp. ATCC 53533]